VEGDEEGDLFDEVGEVGGGLLVCDLDVFGEVFEGDHDLVELVGFEELAEGDGGEDDAFALSGVGSTLTFSMFWDFSAMKRADLKTIWSFSVGI
jgi:hypothetical protein